MVTYAGLIKSLIDQAAREQGVETIPFMDAVGKIVFTDPYTYRIDLNDARMNVVPGEDFQSKRLILAAVRTSAGEGRQIEVIREYGVSLSFQEKIGTNRVPFWGVDFQRPQPTWVQIDFSAQTQELKRFTFAVYLTKVNVAMPIACHLQGSPDGQKWEDLPSGIIYREVKDPNFKVYQVKAPGAYFHYRFYLDPERPLGRVGIERIHLLLWI